MKQILQSLKDGTTRLEDVPTPRAGRGMVLVHTTTTLGLSCRAFAMNPSRSPTGWVTCLRTRSTSVSRSVRSASSLVEAALNGTVPVHRRYSTDPNENRSARGSTVVSERACSGDM